MLTIWAQHLRGIVDTSGLAERFHEDASAAFFDVLRGSRRPLTAQQIKDPVIIAGVPRDDVDRAWRRLQRHLHRSHHIVKAERTYEWTSTRLSPSVALARLVTAARSMPDFVRDDYQETISDALATLEPGSGAELSWTEKKRLEKARLAADLTAGAETVAADGGTGPEVVSWLVAQLPRQQVRVTARLGEKRAFEPGELDVLDGQRPAAGTEVEVVRSGFEYLGTDETTTLVMAQARIR